MNRTDRMFDVSAAGGDPEEIKEVREWARIDERPNDRVALVLSFQSEQDREQMLASMPDVALYGNEARYEPGALRIMDPGDRVARTPTEDVSSIESFEEREWRLAGLPEFRQFSRVTLPIVCDASDRERAIRDRDELISRLGVHNAKTTHGTVSAVWPPQRREDLSSLRFESSAMPDYPVYVPSKGRWQPERALTIKALLRDGVDFRVVVEPQERAEYEDLAGADRVLVLPFSNLRLGSIPARNWIREHAMAVAGRHWQLDDNILEFRRLWEGRRIPCSAGVALRVVEELTDRYSNVGVSGLNYQMFVPAETSIPFYRNVHVYSATLVSHDMPCMWRGRYNEDTDLCLQALDGGWTTLLVNAFMANKAATMTMGGGNTDVLYQGDGRLTMARVLEAAWPGVVKTRWKFGRPQHSVRWDAFTTSLAPADGNGGAPDERRFGIELKRVRKIKSESLRDLLVDYLERDHDRRILDGKRTPKELSC